MPANGTSAREAGNRALAARDQAAPKLGRSIADATRSVGARQFDLLLFDLDDTLLRSSHLKPLRGTENVGNHNDEYLNALRRQAIQLDYLVTEQLLLKLKALFPELQLGVFTRAPRAYAEILLDQRYPNVQWDSLIAYEDVYGHTKPQPEGVLLAARHAQVQNMDRVAVVGDHTTDLLAAYQAGAFAVLLDAGWGSDWKDRSGPERTEHYRALELVPDAVLETPEDLISLITSPCDALPSLESWDRVWRTEQRSASLRVDRLNFFNNYANQDEPRNWVPVTVMGRYFAEHHSAGRPDFHARRGNHLLTREILRIKDGQPYPESWIWCCATRIFEALGRTVPRRQQLIVSAIPARPGRSPRLERLIERLADHVGRDQGAQFEAGLFSFKTGAVPNKTLGQEQRFANIREHLSLATPHAINGAHVLLFDDVVTSGATFYYADRHLRSAGAVDVQCVAMAKTIS